MFNTSNLVFAKDADCLTGGTTYWECSFGFNHAPGTCNATSYEYVIDLEYGECDNGGNDDGVIINPTNPSEGGSSGGGADGGIVTAPDTTPYTQELKDFVSGTLNLADEGVKSYYTSNSNITNTINNYLIQKGFSDFSKFEAMLNLEFGFSLGLNYESFVWAFNNKESEEVKAVKDFLAVNTTTEAKTFVKKVIDIHMGKIEEDIIDDINNPCVGDIIKELQKKDTYGALVPDLKGKGHLSEMVLDLFGECKNYDLTINVAQLGTNSQGFPKNAETKGIESITLDTDLVKDATKLSIAKTLIHESLHVYINFKTYQDREPSLVILLNKYYQKYRVSYPDDVANNLTQHQFISQYVEAMAYSLSAYDNHQQSMDYYTAMSWGGLESSDAYKKLPNKTAIQKIINNERYAKSDAKSTKCK
uniref:SprT-like domain-containing protein n=1 Tax=Tenacibaculum sp. Pbs-1 TaxID=3238748 RepID=A0AB33L3P1_9FLAO